MYEIETLIIVLELKLEHERNNLSKNGFISHTMWSIIYFYMQMQL